MELCGYGEVGGYEKKEMKKAHGQKKKEGDQKEKKHRQPSLSL